MSEWIGTVSQLNLDVDSIKGRVSIDSNVYVEWVYKRHENHILCKKNIFNYIDGFQSGNYRVH